MDSDLVRCEAQADGAMRITPLGSLEDISLLPAVLAVFEQEFRKKHFHFILDLGHLSSLPAGWVALIFELTARSRRRGGELCIANLQRKTQGDLLNFQPESYLCLDEMEFSAPLADLNPALFASSPVPAGGESAPSRNSAMSGIRTGNGESPFQHHATPLHSAQADQPASLEGTKESEEATSAIDIPSRVDALYRACDFVLAIAARLGFGESDLSKIKISVYEASLNAIEHAYHSDASQKVCVKVVTGPDKMVIQIIDRGDGFEVKTSEDFDAIAAAAARRTGGMGLHIIRRSMDKVTYLRDAKNGNCLIMEKRLPLQAVANGAALESPVSPEEQDRADDLENNGVLWPASSD
jgi:anti-sigma regulatory factor (Ser/Thr protein kinase)